MAGGSVAIGIFELRRQAVASRYADRLVSSRLYLVSAFCRRRRGYRDVTSPIPIESEVYRAVISGIEKGMIPLGGKIRRRGFAFE